jgi:hypothetical protein
VKTLVKSKTVGVPSMVVVYCIVVVESGKSTVIVDRLWDDAEEMSELDMVFMVLLEAAVVVAVVVMDSVSQ